MNARSTCESYLRVGERSGTDVAFLMGTDNKRVIMEPQNVPRKRRKRQEESNGYTEKVAPGLLIKHVHSAGQSLPVLQLGRAGAANSADLIERNL